jgi:hypothetical protein
MNNVRDILLITPITYSEVMVYHWLITTDEVRLLSFASSSTRPSSLPSFVPNLLSPPQPACNFALCEEFKAGISDETRHLVRRDVTTENLYVSGYFFGTIEEVVTSNPLTDSLKDPSPTKLIGNREFLDCQKAFGITEPEKYHSFHVDVLLARPLGDNILKSLLPSVNVADPEELPYDAYNMFWCSIYVQEKPEDVAREGLRFLPEIASLVNEDEPKHEIERAWREAIPEDEYRTLIAFVETIRRVCTGRTYFRSVQGFLGLGLPATRPGDKVCILHGVSVPYILRPSEDANTWQLIGDAHVCQIMKGEAFTFPPEERGPEGVFLIC